MLAIALGDLPHFTTFLCLFSYTVTTNLVFSYESISWDIDNRQGFLAGSPIRAVSMTALLDSLKMIKKVRMNTFLQILRFHILCQVFYKK